MRFASPSAPYIGNIFQPGLPNIIGTTPSDALWLDSSTDSSTGAFKRNDIVNGNRVAGQVRQNYSMKLSFDASRYSSIYGNSNTVMPYCMQVPAIIKY